MKSAAVAPATYHLHYIEDKFSCTESPVTSRVCRSLYEAALFRTNLDIKDGTRSTEKSPSEGADPEGLL